MTVADVTALGGFEFTLSYPQQMLHVTRAGLGDFLASTGRQPVPVGPVIDNGAGTVKFGAATTGSAPGPNGDGVLADVCFEPQKGGKAELAFAEGQLTDTFGAVIPVSLHGATVAIDACYSVDMDCDGDVDIVDVQLVAARWGSRQGDALYDAQYDLDDDGDIDIVDVQIVAARWNQPIGTRADVTQTPAAQITFQIDPRILQLTPGAVGLIGLSVSQASNLAAFETTLRYDPAVFEVRSVQMTDWLASTGRTPIVLAACRRKEMEGFWATAGHDRIEDLQSLPQTHT